MPWQLIDLQNTCITHYTNHGRRSPCHNYWQAYTQLNHLSVPSYIHCFGKSSIKKKNSPNTSQCLVALNCLGTLTSIFNVTEVISECKQNLSTFTRQFAISESVIFLRIDFSFTFHVYLIFFLTEALLKLLLVPIIQYILFKEYPIYSYITISVSRYIFVQHFFPGF